MVDDRRRTLLRRLGVAGGVGIAGCQEGNPGGSSETPHTRSETPRPDETAIEGSTDSDPTETETEATEREPSDPDRLVGTHYYPWYEMHGGHRNWTDRTPSEPTLGEYASDDPAVVDQHLQWCLEHGIGWLSMAWWGPNSGSDAALRDAIAETERFEEMQFSILYETVGRMEEFDYDLDDSAARDRLQEDLGYLEETYFRRENYLHMDGRPVVFFYVAGNFRGDVEVAFEEVLDGLDTGLYLLADVPFGTPPDTHAITRAADAVTTYNPYEARPDIENVFHDLYDRGNEIMHLGAEVADVGFVPVAIPGYDDTEIPDHQREDNPILSPSPERYERVCEQVGPHLDASEAVLVTSFNEWYEDTQIEPSETHGTAYLELTAENLSAGTFPNYEPAGVTIRFEFDRTVVPADVEPGSTDSRELAFMAGGLRLLAGNDVVRSYDVGNPSNEPVFLGGAYGPESDGDRSWRWFGGHSARTAFHVAEASNFDSAVLSGQPMRSHEIEADVYVHGTRTDNVEFRERAGTFDDYKISLGTDSS